MKVIQIGCGLFGRWWTPNVVEFPGIELVALVDSNERALEDANEVGGLPEERLFTGLEDALSAVPADVLLCVTPPSMHRAHTTAAMEAGLDVIVEKPLALTMEDAQAIVQTAEKTGRLVAVSQNYRFRHPAWTLRREVQAGAVGQIGQIRLDFYKGWYFDSSNFRKQMDDVLLLDMAVHHFDMLRFITGLEAIGVHGDSWNPPWSENAGDSSLNLTFTLNNGARFVYSASWVAQGDFADWNGNWLIDGDRGSLQLLHDEVFYREAVGHYQTKEPVPVRPSAPPLQNMAYVLADMMAARQEGRQPAVSVADNVRSLGMALAAQEAVRTGDHLAIYPPRDARPDTRLSFRTQ